MSSSSMAVFTAMRQRECSNRCRCYPPNLRRISIVSKEDVCRLIRWWGSSRTT